MAKSPDAFRTISEVSAFLETPPHVLRFWESKFTQVRPVKRAGGRRYYRPDDIALLGGIKVLLHEQGMTIRGVQKMLREQGVRPVASLAPPGALPGWSEGSEDGALEEAEDAMDGVIVGPWAGQAEEGETALEDAEADLAALAAMDGVEPEAPGASWAIEGAGAPEPAAASTLIEAFIAGTASRLAQGAQGVEAAGDAGSEPARPALPPGEPTLGRALELLRRADPDRLRARADRIAPLLARLRAIQGGLQRPRG